MSDMNSCHQVRQEMAAVLLSDRYELIMFVFQIEAGDGVSAAMDQLQQDNVSDWVLGFLFFIITIKHSAKSN